jgi:hypothetical protein
MNTSTVLFSCAPDPGGWSVVWNALHDEVTFTHSNPFTKNTLYTFTITAAQDLDGLDFNSTVMNPITFRTADDNPMIIKTTPEDGAVNVPLNADVVVEFSKPMEASTVLYTVSPAVTMTADWSVDKMTVTYSHVTDFAKYTLYEFRITAGKDTSGYDLIASPVENPFVFTTIGDNPVIEKITPMDGATGVPLNASIIVEFSKPMNTGTVIFASTPLPAAEFTASWNTDGDTVTFSHSADFIKDTIYTMRVASGKDLDGYDLVSGPVPNPWVFRTVGGEPVIVSTDPEDGEIDVKVNEDIIIEFSQSMDTETIHYAITSNAGDPGGWTVTWSNKDRTLTLGHNDFAAKTKYKFEITAGHDLIAIALIPGPVPNPFEFSTGYMNGMKDPTTTLLTPADGASISTLYPILAWNATNNSVENYVYLSTDKAIVTNLDASALILVTANTYHKPTLALEPETVYYWTVIPSDGINEGTCESGVWSFNTPDQEISELTTTLLSPTDGTVVDTHKPTLSWKGSDNAVKYYVYLGTDKAKVATLDSSVLVAIQETNVYTPSNNLARNTTYYWTIIPSDGTYYGSGNVWNFTSPLDEKPPEKEEKTETDSTMWVALIAIIVIIVVILIVLIIVVFLIFKRKKTPPPSEERMREWDREFR